MIFLDEAQENRYRHHHVWEAGRIVEFRIQYEAFIDGRWHPIVCYDSAHVQPHRDTLHPDGSQTKEVYTEIGEMAPIRSRLRKVQVFKAPPAYVAA